MVGAAGVEPANLAVQEPKSCVYANFTTRPSQLKKDKITRKNGENKGKGFSD